MPSAGIPRLGKCRSRSRLGGADSAFCSWALELATRGIVARGHLRRSQARFVVDDVTPRRRPRLTSGIVMVKRNDLRGKLRAADRRRRRRPAAEHSSVSGPTVDVPGLVVEAILRFRDGSQRFDDAIIIAALKACVRGIRPSSTQAATLFDQLQQLASREEVSPRALVRASHELLAQSNQGGRTSGQPNPFASYLAILTS